MCQTSTRPVVTICMFFLENSNRLACDSFCNVTERSHVCYTLLLQHYRALCHVCYTLLPVLWCCFQCFCFLRMLAMHVLETRPSAGRKDLADTERCAVIGGSGRNIRLRFLLKISRLAFDLSSHPRRPNRPDHVYQRASLVHVLQLTKPPE